MAAKIKPRTLKPRYVQVAEELRAEVLAGKIGGAADFPTESVLCERFGCSRFTVREALRRLQDEGLIARKRGSGTVVMPAAARGGTLHQPLSNVAELLQYARDTQVDFQRIGKGRMPGDIAEQVRCATDGDWVHVAGVRLGADSLPLALTDAYIIEALEPHVPELKASPVTLFRQLESLAGFSTSEVTQDIQAIPADARAAAALDVKEGTPCLRILRCYSDDTGRVFEISASLHPGDRFAYEMHIEVG